MVLEGKYFGSGNILRLLFSSKSSVPHQPNIPHLGKKCERLAVEQAVPKQLHLVVALTGHVIFDAFQYDTR